MVTPTGLSRKSKKFSIVSHETVVLIASEIVPAFRRGCLISRRQLPRGVARLISALSKDVVLAASSGSSGACQMVRAAEKIDTEKPLINSPGGSADGTEHDLVSHLCTAAQQSHQTLLIRTESVQTHADRFDNDTEIFVTGAETLKLLAEPTRLHVLWLLSKGPLTVSQLVDAVGAPRTVVSQHLAKLRLGHLVHSQKSGRHVIYSVTDGHLQRLVLEALSQADHVRSGEPHHRADY